MVVEGPRMSAVPRKKQINEHSCFFIFLGQRKSLSFPSQKFWFFIFLFLFSSTS